MFLLGRFKFNCVLLQYKKLFYDLISWILLCYDLKHLLDLHINFMLFFWMISRSFRWIVANISLCKQFLCVWTVITSNTLKIYWYYHHCIFSFYNSSWKIYIYWYNINKYWLSKCYLQMQWKPYEADL